MTQNNYDRLDEYDYVDGEYLYKVFDKYSKLLGSFLISFSILEQELNLAIAEYIHDDWNELGFVIIEKLTIGNKIELFYKMYVLLESMLSKKSKEKLIKIRKQLVVLNLFRNNIVHANWQSLAKDGFVRTKIVVDNQEGYVKFKKIEITPKIIRQKVKEVDDLVDKIGEYTDEARNQ